MSDEEKEPGSGSEETAAAAEDATKATEGGDEPSPSGHTERAVEDPIERERRLAKLSGRWLPWLALVVALVSLAYPVSSAGLWDPHELEVADQSRRIAHTLLGADLALEGANNEVPTLGELSRGQLPFQSMALGFKLFGLTEWAGRLPLVLWGLVGLGAVFLLVSRLADRVAASLSVLALATMPLYYLHARTMLGDVVTMASVAVALAGLAVAVFDRGTLRLRLGAFVLGVTGLAAGYGSRGALLGVAVPALAVGFAWLALLGRLPRGRGRGLLGSSSLAMGTAGAIVGLHALANADPASFDMYLGAAVDKQRQLPTHDFTLRYLASGLFPWSAVIPLALAQALKPPPSDRPDGGSLRLVVILAASLALGAHAVLAPTTGLLPFVGVAALAVLIGVAFRDIQQGRVPALVFSFGVAALAIVLYFDFRTFPSKGLEAFSIPGTSFPESYKEEGTKLIKYGTFALVGWFVWSLLEGPRAAGFDKDEHKRWCAGFNEGFNGNLRFTALLLLAMTAGFAALLFLSTKYFHWKNFETMGTLLKKGGKYAWIAVLAVIVSPYVILAARDLGRFLFSHLPVPRGLAAALGVVVLGVVMSVGYYPALASQISPKEVFTSYQRLAQDGEPLGMLGAGQARSAAYYTGGKVQTFTSSTAAYNWLVRPPEQRRWLVTRAGELAALNSKYRQRYKRNLPVLDGRSSEILLVSNELSPGETNENPYADWFLDTPRAPAVELDVDLGGQLKNLGWEVTDLDGKPVGRLRPEVDYQFRIYYLVERQITGNWKTFIHIDGFGRRHNGDHDTLEGKYPLHLWRVGDRVVDIHPFRLTPNFTPGRYEVFYGLFIGDRRLEVKKGNHHQNRVRAGFVVVE